MSLEIKEMVLKKFILDKKTFFIFSLPYQDNQNILIDSKGQIYSFKRVNNIIKKELKKINRSIIKWISFTLFSLIVIILTSLHFLQFF